MSVSHPHIEFLEAVGHHVIVGTRVPAFRLFSWHRQGTTVETLLRRFPQLGPARIFGALAWAYDNLAVVTHEILAEREAFAKAADANKDGRGPTS